MDHERELVTIYTRQIEYKKYNFLIIYFIKNIVKIFRI